MKLWNACTRIQLLNTNLHFMFSFTFDSNLNLTSERNTRLIFVLFCVSLLYFEDGSQSMPTLAWGESFVFFSFLFYQKKSKGFRSGKLKSFCQKLAMLFWQNFCNLLLLIIIIWACFLQQLQNGASENFVLYTRPTNLFTRLKRSRSHILFI